MPRPGEELRTAGFARTLGGGTLITALAAARLGSNVGVASALSAAAGRRLRMEGVTIKNLRRPDEEHAVSVALSTRKDRAFATFDGANAVLEARLLDWLELRSPRVRHVHIALGPHDLARWIGTIERLRSKGITTSWDFGWHERLPGHRRFASLLGSLDWVLVNEREARHYSGTTTIARATTAWRRLARATVIKRGDRGCVAVSATDVVTVPALRVHAVDTTGAGDAFNGGFLAALVRGQSIGTCLTLGALAGSLSTRKAGGLDALPTLDDVPAWVRRALSAPSPGA